MKHFIFAFVIFLSACACTIIGSNAQKGSNELVGSWRNGRISLLQNKDRTTGSTTPGNGSTFFYRFYPNGRYEFTGYMESTMYNCTTSLFNTVTGTYKISGSELTLVQKTNKWERKNSCSQSSNMTRQGELKTDSFEWHIKQDENGESMCLTYPDGTESCFQKRDDE